MAELYQVGVNTINHHIKSIYEEGEHSPEATIRQYRIVQTEGTGRSGGGRTLQPRHDPGRRLPGQVARGVQFRQWATERLREYLVKGFTLDDERLKGGNGWRTTSTNCLPASAKSAPARRVYQRIREIFALASDYEEGEQETQVFFATMQNKMHYAAAGMTAAEIVRRRADAGKANMGLTAWSGGRVLKRDVATAKNYLTRRKSTRSTASW